MVDNPIYAAQIAAMASLEEYYVKVKDPTVFARLYVMIDEFICTGKLQDVCS